MNNQAFLMGYLFEKKSQGQEGEGGVGGGSGGSGPMVRDVRKQTFQTPLPVSPMEELQNFKIPSRSRPTKNVVTSTGEGAFGGNEPETIFKLKEQFPKEYGQWLNQRKRSAGSFMPSTINIDTRDIPKPERPNSKVLQEYPVTLMPD